MRNAFVISLVLVLLRTAAAKPPRMPVVHFSASEAAVLATHNPLPEYPVEARRRRIEGSSLFLMEVAIPTGRVLRVKIERSTGSRLLDAAAVSAFKRWQFKPELLRALQRKYAPHETSLEAGIGVPVNFTLRKA